MSVKQLETPIIGDYTIISEIGQGMLGKVYRAEHRFLKKSYALKILPEELAENTEFIERLEKEVALLVQLDHPNIAALHSVSIADGRAFLVYDGVFRENGAPADLSSLLKLGKSFSEEEVFAIAKQIATALDFAHEKGIAHQGLKLSNIFFTSGDEINVKVSDFGLTRIVGIGAVLSRTYKILWEMMAFEAGFERGELSSERYLPFSGEVAKLHNSFEQHYTFLAPEQRGKTSPDLIAKSDLYSFGILLYYLLVGHFPIGFFPMPSECNLQLKYQWDHLVKSCLDFDPERRPDPLLKMVEEVQGQSLPKLKPQELSRPTYEADPSSVFQTDKGVAKYRPKEQKIETLNPLLTKMHVIEGGTFLRGSNNGARDEMPRHAVHLPSYAIDIHPVTNEQFLRFLTVMGGEKDANNNDIIRLRDSRIRREGGNLSIESGYAKHPVVGVTWFGAYAYAKWVGKRLPTEAEWEVAAYGGIEGASYPTGESIERSQANFFNSDTTSVMSYPENGHGIFDMSGNVYEWCLDWYGYHYYETSMQEPENPQGPSQGVYRVLRGGCWKSLKEDMRCSHRHRNKPGIMNGTYGFRCVADV